MGRPKKYKPNDLKTIHDRRTTDLLRNAQVAPVEVDDPFEHGAKLIVMRSTRGDPLAGMQARNMIDEAQYMAGRAFQRDFEVAERGPRAIDPSKEAVDGGRPPEPLTDEQKKAVVRLAGADRQLGQNGSAIVRSVLIDGLSIEHICELRHLKSDRERLYIGRRFRECLDELAEFYGFAMASK